jgi:hypothetical protein
MGFYDHSKPLCDHGAAMRKPHHALTVHNLYRKTKRLLGFRSIGRTVVSSRVLHLLGKEKLNVRFLAGKNNARFPDLPGSEIPMNRYLQKRKNEAALGAGFRAQVGTF